MYLRAIHAETSIKALFELIQQNPLGVLTTAIPSTTQHFIQSSHIPWVLDIISDDPDAPVKGRLRGHMARQNPHSKTFIEALDAAGLPSASPLQQEVQVLFTTNTHHYVTPKFYTETKPATAKVVPTWNYAAVQAYGKAKIYHDSSAPETSEYLQKQIQDLSELSETSIMGYTGEGDRPDSWKVSEAPERYIEIMKKNIIGIEITIEDIGGKFKMSQESTKGDRDGVIQGFENLGTELGRDMAALVRERGEMKDAAKK
ncbi:putative transcriptional regulator [Aspergillus bombycis]|uniref:Putative transcriptional regulator n=1 Tax=Aspergillus bombycis TaxID=109264 RepID=A0A1F7ZYI7_9EURO|nr:putative transcriptional regulator [Aspergillus bombycis]OGM44155.1 putative transcriptional regulator [Aspergillus bombycis]